MWAQDNSCFKNYEFVKNWVEKNSASFADNVTGNRKELYVLHCDSIQQLIINNPNANCLSLLQAYLSFFQDNHLSISYQFNDDDTSQLHSFYQSPDYRNTQTVELTTTRLQDLEKNDTASPIYNDNTHLYEFRLLNDSTCYVRLSTFGGWLYRELDSFYAAVIPVITAKRYLIIDIRNNGGGSDGCYKALRPLFYTQPIESDIVDILATPENLARYQKELKLMISHSDLFGEEAIKEKIREVRVMKKTRLYHFARLQPKQYFILKTIPAYPKKIALVFNKATASSAEDLIFDARQSKKVITIGENSGGYTGYGNVYEVSIPHSNLTFTYSTTRYRIQKQYDGIGFTPMYRVNEGEHAIAKALEVLRE